MMLQMRSLVLLIKIDLSRLSCGTITTNAPCVRRIIVGRTQRKKSHLQFQLWCLSYTVNTFNSRSLCMFKSQEHILPLPIRDLAQKYQGKVLAFWITIFSVKGLRYLGQSIWKRQENLMKKFSPFQHVMIILQRPKLQERSQKLK